MTEIVRVDGLRKVYDRTVALRGLDLAFEEGGVIGVVGPNGAGKTTLVEILEGLRSPTSGTVRVFGVNPADDTDDLKERIGIQLQATSLPEALTVGETLSLFSAFYERTRSVEEVLSRVGLAELRDRRTESLSGGQKQRLVLGMALVNDPELLFLDEPTAGLDPGARRALHDHIRELRAEGRTILLTTHYIEEAEELCDRVVVLRDGEVVADGSPFDLVRRAGGRTILWLSVRGPLDTAPLLAAGAEPEGEEEGYHRFSVPDPAAAIEALLPVLSRQEVALEDLRLKRPDLEDLYLELTGGPGSAAGMGQSVRSDPRAGAGDEMDEMRETSRRAGTRSVGREAEGR